MPHHRHDQAVFSLRGDADMHRTVLRNDAGIVIESAHYLREFAHCQHHRAH